MPEQALLSEFEVIGTTTPIEDLPKRLSPVYRQLGSEDTCYFTVDGRGTVEPLLSPESPELFAEMVARGEAVRFDPPIPARSGFCLVQLETGGQPEYVANDELADRLFRACREALVRASHALREGRRDEAESLAWYARRASDDNPLPLLLLIALLRGEVPQEELRFLEGDLVDYSQDQIKSAHRRARERDELAAIGDLLDEAPRSGERPAYLLNYKSKPGFLATARARNGNARRRPRAA